MKRKKTERIYLPIHSLAHFAEKLGGFSDRTAYRYFVGKDLNIMTYGQLSRGFYRLTRGFSAMGLGGKRIAVIGETSPEWVMTYVSAIAGGGVAIPLDRELEGETLYGFLEKAKADALVYSDTLADKFATPVDACRFIPMSQLESIMQEGDTLTDWLYPETEDLNRVAELLFTSGTTGSAKCVMLTEKNICSAVNAACETVDFSAEDRIVSVLPIHHTYELCIMLAGLNYGMNIAINDSIKHVLKNFAFFKPTGLVLVPLYVTTMNKKIWDEARKKKQDKLLKALLKISGALLHVGIDLRRVFFKSVLDAFGGSLNKIICGGAALNPELCKTFSGFDIEIYEGYGITECSPLIAVNPYFAPKSGSVGPSVPCCQVRIEPDHENDFGYAEGEIQVLGDNVMPGYYEDEENTKNAFTQDGWFCTGDVGYMDKDGYIYITGRKKYVIVLQSGKNVFPEEIEERLSELPSVCESVVLGRKNGDDVVLTAIVYPNQGFTEENVKEDIAKMNRDLPIYKQIRAVEMREIPFEKTTSRKIKRHLVQ